MTFDTSVPDPLMTGFGGYVDVFAAADSGTQLLDAFQVQVAITLVADHPDQRAV